VSLGCLDSEQSAMHTVSFLCHFSTVAKSRELRRFKMHSYSKIHTQTHTHTLSFSFTKYEIVTCNQKMALQSSRASWNHRDAAFKFFFFILAVPFFLSGNTPVAVSSGFTESFFFPPGKDSLSPKSSFFVWIGHKDRMLWWL